MEDPMRALAFSLALVAPTLLLQAAHAAEKVDAGKTVVVRSGDKKKLAATSWDEPAENAAGVVLLHMYRSDRNAWKPLVPHLRARGIEVLAIDLRGHGESLKHFKKRVEKRDAKVFAKMYHDAIGGVRWLVKTGKCDPKRIALVGASVGCSVAIDTARQYPDEIAAVLCLSPGANYLGLNSVEHGKTYPAKVPLLLAVHQGEIDAGAKRIHEAIAGSRLLVFRDTPPPGLPPEGNWAHGTHMFGRIRLVEQTVASFVAARTGSKRDDVVLDGIVEEEAAEGGAWTRATALSDARGVKGWAYRVGRRVMFAGRIEGHASKSVQVGVATHFPKGTAPGLSTNPKLGFPELGTYDLATGACVWVEPHDGHVKAKRKDVAQRDRPPVRVVRTETGYTFEGEWETEYGDGKDGPVGPSRVELSLVALAEIPEPPEEIAPGAIALPLDWADSAVEVASR
jgi:pimeloyl-ACP methyl ester carboxylesterase